MARRGSVGGAWKGIDRSAQVWTALEWQAGSGKDPNGVRSSDKEWNGRRGMSRNGWPRIGMARHGMAGRERAERHGLTRLGQDRQARRGPSGIVIDGSGLAGLVGPGKA